MHLSDRIRMGNVLTYTHTHTPNWTIRKKIFTSVTWDEYCTQARAVKWLGSEIFEKENINSYPLIIGNDCVIYNVESLLCQSHLNQLQYLFSHSIPLYLLFVLFSSLFLCVAVFFFRNGKNDGWHQTIW